MTHILFSECLIDQSGSSGNASDFYSEVVRFGSRQGHRQSVIKSVQGSRQGSSSTRILLIMQVSVYDHGLLSLVSEGTAIKMYLTSHRNLMMETEMVHETSVMGDNLRRFNRLQAL